MSKTGKPKSSIDNALSNRRPVAGKTHVESRQGAESHAQGSEETDKMDLEDIYLAVMGVTGSGKSSFIERCSGQNVGIGHTLVSCTVEVREYTFVHERRVRVHLLDTPGFDDTSRSDADVLREIVSYLGEALQSGVRLTGVLFIHRISDPRMAGSAKKNLRMFKKLCGKTFYPSIVLATTFWEGTVESVGAERERELQQTEDFWGHMLKNGSRTERLYNSRESALRVLEMLLQGHEGTLQIQKETIEERMDLNETSAGREVVVLLDHQEQKVKANILLLEEDKLAESDIEAAEEIEKEVQTSRKRLEQIQNEKESMRKNFQTLQREKEEELLRMLEEVRQMEAKLGRMKSDGQAPEEEVKQEEQKVIAGKASIAARSNRFAKDIKVWVKGRWAWLKDHPEIGHKLTQLTVKIGEGVLLASIGSVVSMDSTDSTDYTDSTDHTDSTNYTGSTDYTQQYY